MLELDDIGDGLRIQLGDGTMAHMDAKKKTFAGSRPAAVSAMWAAA